MKPKTTWLGNIIQWTVFIYQWTDKNTESHGQRKSMEKDDPWCGQPSDLG